jgi:hypothetical protein
MIAARLAAAAVGLGLVLSPLPAAAQSLVGAADPEALAGVIRDLGFQARVDKDNTGDPLIRSSANGGDFQIEFYGCTENRECKTLRFYAGYDLRDGTTLDVVNQWNVDKRFASAYLDDEDDPFLQMDVNTEGGISRVAFETSFEVWQSLKGQFESHINFRR